MFKVIDSGVLKGLNAAQKKIVKNVYNAMQIASNIIVDSAKVKCPVRTGRLRNSIDFKVNISSHNIVSEIGTDVYYSGYVEFGTVRMAARPYLRPALTENKQKILNCFKGILK